MRFDAVLHRSVVLGLLLLTGGGTSQALAAERIWAEALINKTRAYVHETVVYRVRVFSQGNLRSIQISPPSGAGASLEELEGPNTSSKTIRGRQYIVNEFRFALTPMTEGLIEVEPVELTVTPAAENRTPYGGGMTHWPGRAPAKPGPVKVSTRAVTLNALPPVRGVQPWLPLEFLDVGHHWSKSDRLDVGDPITLTVTMKARGAKGSQLPSLASLLEESEFKVYPERPQTDWKFSADGEALWGRRVESYTLVPTREGQLTFPRVTLPWWNVLDEQPAVAKIPSRVFGVGDGYAGSGGTAGPDQPSFVARMLEEHTFLHYALPVGGGLLLAFAMGIWLGSGSPGGGVLARAGTAGVRQLRALGALAGKGVASTGRTLLPERMWRGVTVGAQRGRKWGEGLLGWVVAAMPPRVKTWWCVQCVASEKDPEGLCHVLRRYACDHLNMEANAPLPAIANRIAQERPGADAASLNRLFQELDDAAYGGKRIDLAKWKRAFKRRFGGTMAKSRDERAAQQEMGLPKLNP